MVRISGGAAIIRTTTASSTCTMSTGVPVAACMSGAPACSAPKSRPPAPRRPAAPAEQRDRDGVDAVGPEALVVEGEVGALDDRRGGQAGQAAAIGMTRTSASHVHARHPRRAGVLADAADSNPMVVRSSSHQMPAAQASATRKPALMRRCVPNSSGRCAFPAMAGVIGLTVPGACSGSGRRAGRPGSRP